MKKLICLLAVVVALMPFSTVLAFGISPPEVEFDVPNNGNATVEFATYDFTGNLEISLEDIPLRVEPQVVSVVDGSKVSLTFYGNGDKAETYNGYVRFLASSGDMVAMGIKVKATIHQTGSSKVVEITGATPFGWGTLGFILVALAVVFGVWFYLRRREG